MKKYLWVPMVLLMTALLVVYRRHDAASKAAVQAAKTALLDNIKRFVGCFQPLMEAVQDKNVPLARKIMELWGKRSVNFPELHRYLEALQTAEPDALSAAKTWIRTLESWGIRHDTVGEVFEITKEQETRYFFDDIYEYGNRARVVRPAWWTDGEDAYSVCIETGAAEIE